MWCIGSRPLVHPHPSARGRPGGWPRVGALAVLLASAAPLAAQGAPAAVRLDEGSFTLLADGQRIGREQFSLWRRVSPEGLVFEVRAESAVEDRRRAMRLEVDSAGTPLRFSLEEQLGTELALRLGGQRLRGRFATLARSLTGEAAREYLLRPGAVIVEEDGIAHHLLLVRDRRLAAGDGITLPSLTPTANSQGVVRIVLESAADTVAIGGSRRAARRWRVVTGTGEVRQLWADAEGRLLQLRIPTRGLEARRDDAPR